VQKPGAEEPWAQGRRQGDQPLLDSVAVAAAVRVVRSCVCLRPPLSRIPCKGACDRVTLALVAALACGSAASAATIRSTTLPWIATYSGTFSEIQGELPLFGVGSDDNPFLGRQAEITFVYRVPPVERQAFDDRHDPAAGDAAAPRRRYCHSLGARLAAAGLTARHWPRKPRAPCRPELSARAIAYRRQPTRRCAGVRVMRARGNAALSIRVLSGGGGAGGLEVGENRTVERQPAALGPSGAGRDDRTPAAVPA
jgi:hypothetical protein